MVRWPGNMLIFLMILFGQNGELNSQDSDRHTDVTEQSGHIEVIAIVEPRDSLTGPGIWIELAAPFEPEFIRWVLQDQSGILPHSFREAARAFFYLPVSGDFKISAEWYYGPFLKEEESVILSISESSILLTHRPGLPGESTRIVGAESFEQQLNVWQQLNLAGSHSKPFTVAGVPWYVPAGLAVAGGGIWIASSGGSDGPEPGDAVVPLIARDLTVQLQCPDGVEIYPLSNDEGKGLKISEVIGLSADAGHFFPPDRIELFPGLRENMSLSYRVEDAFGQFAAADVFIQVNLPFFELRDLEYAVNAGESLQGNVFENDDCVNCELKSYAQGVSGSVSFENGNFNYQSDDLFGGLVEISYEAMDACGQSGMAVLKIDIEPACDLEISVEVTSADCGLENGSVEVNAEQDGNFTINWEDGSNAFLREDMSSGTYAFTVTDEYNGCTYHRETEISSLATSYFQQLNPIIGNCLESPDATIFFNNPGLGPLVLVLEGPGGDLTTELVDWGSGTSLTELWQGNFFEGGAYRMLAYDYSAGISCAEERLFELEETPLSLNAADDELIVSQGTQKTINLLSNDTGTGLVLEEVENPPFGQLDFQSDGEITYTAPANEFGVFNLLYEISDSCGSIETALLQIEVLECEIAAEFEVENADCGLSDGSIRVLIEDEERYWYQWSIDGDSTFSGNLSGGLYELTITEKSTNCTREFEIEVDYNKPQAVNDSFTVNAIDTLRENILENDLGTDLTITFFESLSEGYLVVEEDGQMTFSAAGEFSGRVEFHYAVIDSCGGTDTALVVIEVLPLRCEAEWQLQIDSTDCGLDNATVAIEVETDCEYELIWHDGSHGDTLADQAAGTYELMLILSGDAFEVDTLYIDYEIVEKPLRYIVVALKESGSCIESGKIYLELESPGDGDFEIEIRGPEGNEIVETTDQIIELSDFLYLKAGEYTIYVRDKSLNCDKRDSVLISLTELPLDLLIQDIFLEVLSGETISFNVLEGATGKGLNVSGHTAPEFGALTISARGDAAFSTEIPEHGLIEVEFFVVDSCGQRDTALLVIEVELPPCDFEVEFEISEADCGFSNGSIVAEINKSGDFLYFWSNGETGNQISDLPAGSYGLTVEDVLLQCELEFSADLPEFPPDWLVGYEVIPIGCEQEGSIILELQNPAGPLLEVRVTGPGIGSSLITVMEGTTDLSNFFVFQFGTYTVEVNPVGSNCKQEFDAVIELISDPLQIILLEAVPPESIQQQNGSITIEIVDGIFPVSVFLNGEFHGTAEQSFYQISDLGHGVYEIFAVDDENCTSNALEVELLSGQGSFSMVVNNSFSNGELHSLSDVYIYETERPGWSPGVEGTYELIAGRSTSLLFEFRPLSIGGFEAGLIGGLHHQSAILINRFPGDVAIFELIYGRLSAGPFLKWKPGQAGLNFYCGWGPSILNVRELASTFLAAESSVVLPVKSSPDIKISGEYDFKQGTRIYGGIRFYVPANTSRAVREIELGLEWRF